MSDRKSTFSVNRMEAFSDGVLAIIITLLILVITGQQHSGGEVARLVIEALEGQG